MTQNIDPRIVQALEEAELPYQFGDGELLLNLTWGETSKAVVSLESGTYEYEGVELRCIRSIAYSGGYPPPSVLAYCLEDNSISEVGAWEASFNRDKNQCELAFCAKVGASLDGHRVKKIIFTVARAANTLRLLLASELS